MKVDVVQCPGPDAGHSRYPNNRPPLQANPLIKLPLGAVRPAGWLRHQLDLMADGMTGRLTEVSQFLAPDNGWFGTGKEGWEEQPYWFRGFYSLARLTEDPRLVSEAARWIEAVLASQDADGYFGASAHKRVTGKNGQVVCDLWPHMVMLDAVIRHHEATGDARVIPFVTRFFVFCRELPEEQFIPDLREGFGEGKPSIQRARAGDMLPHIYWLYNQTGEAWLLRLATRFFHRIGKPSDEWLDHHVIHFIQRFSYPGVYSTQSRAAWHLALSEYWYHQHQGTWGQQPRGIFGADENIRPGCVDPRQGFETCGFGEFAKNFYFLGRLTGQALYADRVEDLLFNHFPASQTPDLKALHYLTASNQPQLDASLKHEYHNKGRQIDYSPWETYRCCQHNVAMTWPWLVENLWQASADGGLVAWIYSGCEVTAAVAGGHTVRVREETNYPFSGEVKLTMECGGTATFPLYLRIPRWCRTFRVQLNGHAVAVDTCPGQYVRMERAWTTGDVVGIAMSMSLALTTWPRTGSVTVACGPLSFSLKIGERWNRCGGTDAWPEWEVFPTTPWNYGLVLDASDPLAGFKILEKGHVEDQPWTSEAAPVEIDGAGQAHSGMEAGQ